MKRSIRWMMVAALSSTSLVALAQDKKPDVQVTPENQVPQAVLDAAKARMEQQKAQAMADAQAAPEIVPPIQGTWSDSDLESIGRMLVGTWMTEDTGPNRVFLGVGHVGVAGMTDVMYFETCRANSLHTPYRHGLWQLYKKNGKPHLRTMEFRRQDGKYGALYTMWATPDIFPPVIKAEDIVATMDIELTPGGGGFTGRSPHAYPTARGGAVEMMSDLDISKDTISVADRGLDASGKVVWGGEKKTALKRVESPVGVKREPNGLAIIDYKMPNEGMTATDKCRVAINYYGWLTDNTMFDTTRKAGGNPFVFDVGGSVIPGFAQGIADCKQGDRRRLIIPPDLGFGASGNRRNKIPGNATLVYDIEVVAVDPPAPQPITAPAGPMPSNTLPMPAPEAKPAEAKPEEKHDHPH